MAEARSLSQQALSGGYEPEDVGIRGILLVAAASLVILVAIGGALWGMVALFAANREQQPLTPVEQTRIAPPSPRLQTAPDRDLAALRAREEATLRQFGWIDRSAGVVQIPIEMAMDLLSRRGWPQPDRPAEPVPPRAADFPDQLSGPTGSNNGPAPIAPRPVPRATPQGGLR